MSYFYGPSSPYLTQPLMNSLSQVPVPLLIDELTSEINCLVQNEIQSELEPALSKIIEKKLSPLINEDVPKTEDNVLGKIQQEAKSWQSSVFEFRLKFGHMNEAIFETIRKKSKKLTETIKKLEENIEKFETEYGCKKQMKIIEKKNNQIVIAFQDNAANDKAGVILLDENL